VALDAGSAPAYTAAAGAVAEAALREAAAAGRDTEGGGACTALRDFRAFLTSACAKDCSLMVAFRVSSASAATVLDAPRWLSSGGVHESRSHASSVGFSLSSDTAASLSHGTLVLPLQLAKEEQPEASDPPDSLCGTVTAEPASPPPRAAASITLVHYSVAVVDLDPKPLSRIPHYVQLDDEISRAWEAVGPAVFAALGRPPMCVPLAAGTSTAATAASSGVTEA
jgi:hypothetical protein